jgi:peptide subunit release factor 1 (eRF1)
MIKVKESLYRCDTKFHIDQIVGMYQGDHIINGVIYTDGKICVNYELKYQILSKLSSSTIHLQNQFKNGGQSANRLMRNREIQRDHYITQMAEKIILTFYDKDRNVPRVKNLVFCGPAQFKIEISEHKLIKSFFDVENIHLINMAEMDYNLLINTVSQFDDPDEKKVITEIRELIALADNKLVFGQDIVQSIESCEIKTLYIHRDHDTEDLCKNMCENEYQKQIVQMIKDPEINKRINVVKVSSHMIMEYGGLIGVRFF